MSEDSRSSQEIEQLEEAGAWRQDLGEVAMQERWP